MDWWAKPSNCVPTWPISLTTSSSLDPRRLDGWFMNVRLVWTSKRRVPENGILSLRTWASSIVSPVLIRRIAFNSVSGFMWLAEPRSSPAPHLDGQRWLSAGGFQVWAWARAPVRPSASAAAAMPSAMGRIRDLLGARMDARPTLARMPLLRVEPQRRAQHRAALLHLRPQAAADETAVDHERVAVDEARLVAGEPQRRLCDVQRLAGALDRL